MDVSVGVRDLGQSFRIEDNSVLARPAFSLETRWNKDRFWKGWRRRISRRPQSAKLRKSKIHVGNSLIDLLRTLEADRSAVYTRVLECKPHRFHTIVVTVIELPPAT